MDPLVKRRSHIQSKIASINTIANKHATTPLLYPDVDDYIKRVKEYREEVEKIQDEMIDKCADDTEIKVQTDLSEKLEEKFFDVLSKLRNIKIAITPAAVIPVVPPPQPQDSVKLPRIQLPSFSGSYQEWSSFQDLFVATVHNNTSLAGAQKLQYLKSSLSGDAANLIKSFPVTDVSYDEAWKLLKDRYENEREIVYSILARFVKQPSMSSESAPGLQKLLDTTQECIRSLKVLGRPVDKWDDILVFLMVDKLDPESRCQWALSLVGTSLPSFNKLSEFLTKHIRGIQAGAGTGTSKPQQPKPNNPHSNSAGRQAVAHHNATQQKCAVCGDGHYRLACPSFRAMSEPERSKTVRAKALCVNCLNPGHGLKDCTKSNQCRSCSGKHHTFVHRQSQPQSQQQQPTQNATVTTCITGQDATQVLLSTALVKINGHVVRAFLDSGSQASFITEACVKNLGLKRQKTYVSISGVASTNIGSARSQVAVCLTSCVNASSVEVDALVLPKVTGILPRYPCKQTMWPHLEGLTLADPTFNKPGPIDLLIGADIMAWVMRDGRRPGPPNTPIAVNSIFSWVLSGRVIAAADAVVESHHIECETDTILRKFWEIEELPPQRHMTADEKLCETHFSQTHSRDMNGRFIVKFPIKTPLDVLGLSRQRAIARLKMVERRLDKNPDFLRQYNDFMAEYIQLKHMEPVPHAQILTPASYYLPHHFVLKLDSTTTNFRVVFDGSCETTSGMSLNKCLMVGPTLQDSIFTLLLRFRCHVIALKADISKMYRQFNVSRDEADYQRIVWRESPDHPVQDYRLLTLTYGTASAPYLATKCLQQLADDEREKFPLAAPVLKNDFYVDDLMGGESTPERAMDVQRQLSDLVRCGGMELRKWSSSDPSVLASIPRRREKEDNLSLDKTTGVKALGVQWNPSTDSFTFKVTMPDNPQIITKRRMLSEYAKVFDPIGLLSPTTITAKIAFQDLWKQKTGWDDDLPFNIQERWNQYLAELPLLRQLRIPRCVISPKTVSKQFVGFSDASEKAYAAVVYLRSELSDGDVLVRIVGAKTKVSPIQQVCIPRLELCSAVLLANLVSTVQTSTKINCAVSLWSDSTVTLKWLESFPGRWKTFVANRVAEIQGLYPSDIWRHVRSEDKPADCASRGILASELIDNSLWWNGPAWLKNREMPFFPYTVDMNLVRVEERQSLTLTHPVTTDKSWVNDFSTLRRLQEFTAYSLSFILNTKSKREDRMSGGITSREYAHALLRLIRLAQKDEFTQELKALSSKKPLPSTSNLLQLNPFIDSTGILRVGGRLQKANIHENSKHPIILPHHHHLTKLIIDHAHVNNLHAGFQLLWSTLSRRYWILRPRDTIRHQIRKCVTCRKQRAEVAQQLMGSLPTVRVNPHRPFLNAGLDYAGPYYLRVSKGRSNRTSKCYFCIFVCMAVKAVHLEAVSDLTTEAFLAALKRFFARRGISSNLYSDCGTNFVGADKELKKMLKCGQHNSVLADRLAKHWTTWHFNSPASPHHGGLWEAAVKSTKYHLKRVMGNALLTYEEFQTVLCQVESCLNSRPLCALSNDPTDFDAQTPAHFLVGEPLNSIPEGDLTTLKVNRLSRWQHTQQIVQHFWRRWSAEYLTSLQQRFKWTRKRDDLQVGDLVLVKQDNLPPNQWSLSRIILLHPGADNHVRVVTVKTQAGEFDRPIVKLCPILSNDE